MKKAMITINSCTKKVTLYLMNNAHSTVITNLKSTTATQVVSRMHVVWMNFSLYSRYSLEIPFTASPYREINFSPAGYSTIHFTPSVPLNVTLIMRDTFLFPEKVVISQDKNLGNLPSSSCAAKFVNDRAPRRSEAKCNFEDKSLSCGLKKKKANEQWTFFFLSPLSLTLSFFLSLSRQDHSGRSGFFLFIFCPLFERGLFRAPRNGQLRCGTARYTCRARSSTASCPPAFGWPLFDENSSVARWLRGRAKRQEWRVMFGSTADLHKQRHILTPPRTFAITGSTGVVQDESARHRALNPTCGLRATARSHIGRRPRNYSLAI